MAELVQMQLPSGQTIWARVSTDEGAQDVSISSLATVVLVDGFAETVAAVAESVRLGLHNLAPREVNVEFGIELHAKTGKIISVLAEAGGKASVKITLTWDGTDNKLDQAG